MEWWIDGVTDGLRFLRPRRIAVVLRIDRWTFLDRPRHMTFEKFRSLIRAGEKAFVDFKLMCNAFNGAVPFERKTNRKRNL